MSQAEKTEITLVDVHERIVKSRQSLGLICGLSHDLQMVSALSLIEESLSVAESMLSLFIEEGIDEEYGTLGQDVPFD